MGGRKSWYRTVTAAENQGPLAAYRVRMAAVGQSTSAK